jgi:hypothetical protein
MGLPYNLPNLSKNSLERPPNAIAFAGIGGAEPEVDHTADMAARSISRTWASSRAAAMEAAIPAGVPPYTTTSKPLCPLISDRLGAAMSLGCHRLLINTAA